MSVAADRDVSWAGQWRRGRAWTLALCFVVFQASMEVLLVLAKAWLARMLLRLGARRPEATGKAAPGVARARTPMLSTVFVCTFLLAWVEQFALDRALPASAVSVPAKLRYCAGVLLGAVSLPWAAVHACARCVPRGNSAGGSGSRPRD